MDKQGILKLARLARIKLEDHDAEKLSGEFGKILSYVSEVKEAAKKVTKLGEKNAEEFVPRNVLRTDDNRHEGGIFTEAILKQAPSREKNYIKVKRIL